MVARKRILIVDESINIRKLIKVVLDKIGDYEYVEAANGSEGMDKVLLHRPDLVISELVLTGLNGIELCRQVRCLSKIPIIVLTSQTTIKAVEMARETGVNIFMKKPFELADLRDSVQTLIGERAGEAGKDAVRVVREGEKDVVAEA